MKKIYCSLTLFLVIVLVSCNLPGGIAAPTSPTSPDAAFTQAAETVAAKLTEVPTWLPPTPVVPTNTPNPTDTPQPAATNTQVFTPTNTPIPCNLAAFVTDVTYPDNTQVAPNQAFV